MDHQSTPQTPRKQDNLAAFEHAFSSLEGASNKRHSFKDRSRPLSVIYPTTAQNQEEQLDKVLELLQERDKDVALAAEIGKVLVERNKEFEYKNEELSEKLQRETQRTNQLERAIENLEKENKVLSEMQAHEDEVGKLEQKIVTLEASLVENKAEMDAILRKCDSYKLKAAETEAARIKLSEQMYNRDLDEDAKLRKNKADYETTNHLQELNKQLFEQLEDYKVRFEKHAQTEAELKKTNKAFLEEKEAALKQLKETGNKLGDLQLQHNALVNSRKPEQKENVEFTASQEALQRVQNDKAKLEAKYAQVLLENAQLHKRVIEQAGVMAQLRSEALQTQQLLVTPRTKSNNVRGSILSELQSAFSNKLSQMKSSGSFSQPSIRIPIVSARSTATDFTELNTPKRGFQKQASEVSHTTETMDSDNDEDPSAIASRKEDMGVKPTEELIIEENIISDDLEAQESEDSKMPQVSLLRHLFKLLISTIANNIAKRPFVTAITTITVGEVVDTWMALFNINAE